MAESRINIPPLGSVKTAVEMYWKKPALYNPDIQALFPGVCRDTVQKLKRLARAKTQELGNLQWNNKAVNTADAYIAWGLDIDNLEKRYAKLKKLGVET